MHGGRPHLSLEDKAFPGGLWQKQKWRSPVEVWAERCGANGQKGWQKLGNLVKRKISSRVGVSWCLVTPLHPPSSHLPFTLWPQ